MRMKIIRNDSIGNFSWDASKSENLGLGINEWSQADLMKLLNPGYNNESVDGSLYWNRESGTCYNGQGEATISCDFSDSGLKEPTKTMIGESVWHTGANGTESTSNIVTSKFYELERSTNNGKICTGGLYCNDTMSRTTTWKGHLALMYPSEVEFGV